MVVVLLGWAVGLAPDSYAASRKPTAGIHPQPLIAWTHEDTGSREFDLLSQAAGIIDRTIAAHRGYPYP